MSVAVIADTTPLYALVDSDDQYAQIAREHVRSLDESGMYIAVPIPVLLEAHNLILRRLGVSIAQAWLQQIIESTFTPNPNDDDIRDAVDTTRRYPDQPITLTDAVVAAMSQRLRIPVWTYDHHFDIMQVEVWRTE